jgi:hypothetical protein
VRKVLVGLGVGVLSLPLVFVLWLLVAVRLPQMDAFTIRMPSGVRSTVADVAMDRVPYGKAGLAGTHRVIALNPENQRAWDRLCGWESQDADAHGLKDCEKAVSMDDSAGNWDDLGEAQEAARNECAAADSYTKAASKGSSGLYYGYAEHLGRASLRCGNYYDARAGLAAAIDLEGKEIKDPDADEEDIANDKASQLTDREYLIVTMDHLQDADGAKASCSSAHPDWKGCACKLDAKGEVACVEAAK